MKISIALLAMVISTPVFAADNSFILLYSCAIQKICQQTDLTDLDLEILSAKPDAEQALNVDCESFIPGWAQNEKMQDVLKDYASQIRSQGGETCIR